MVDLGTLEIGLRLDRQTLDRDINVVRGDLAKVGRNIPQINIKPFVDHQPLKDLNEHLDKKVKHLKEVNAYFRNNPVKVIYGYEGDFGSAEVGSNRSSSSVKNNYIFQDENIVSAIKNLGNDLKELFKTSNKYTGETANNTKFKIIPNLFKSIFTGFAEKIGGTLASEFVESPTRSVSKNIKRSVQHIDQNVIGGDAVYETFFAELLSSGSLQKSLDASIPRANIGKVKQRVEKLIEIATMPTQTIDDVKAQIRAIQSDSELAPFLKQAKEIVKQNKVTKQGSTNLTDVFFDLAQPRDMVRKMAHPIIEAFQPLLRFISNMQSYNNQKLAEKYYRQRKGAFPNLEPDEVVVSVIGGAQFMEGQGSREIALVLQAIDQLTRYIPVENPQTDNSKANQQFDNFIKKMMAKLAPDLASNPHIGNNVVNALRQAFFAINPLAKSDAVAQAMANTKLAQEKGGKGVVTSYSLGGSESFNYAKLAEYMGIDTDVLAMAYPFFNWLESVPKNFKAVLSKQDPLGFVDRVGINKDNKAQSIVDTGSLPSTDAHGIHHLFSSDEFVAQYLDFVNKELVNSSQKRNLSPVVKGMREFFRTMGLLEQISSYTTTGKFDFTSVFKGFDIYEKQKPYSLGTMLASLFEKKGSVLGAFTSGTYALEDPTRQAIGKFLTQKFDLVEKQVREFFAKKNISLPNDNLSGYFKYEADANYTNELISKTLDGSMSLDEVKERLSVHRDQTIGWFSQQTQKDTFGEEYVKKIIAGYKEFIRVAEEAIKTNGKFSKSFIDTVQYSPANKKVVDIFNSASLDTMKLDTEEQARGRKFNISKAIYEDQDSITAYNKILNAVGKENIPKAIQMKAIGSGMSGARALMTEDMVYKTDLDPSGASLIGSDAEVDAYNRLQGRYSPLLYKAVKGEAVITERIKGTPVKDILNEAVKPYKDLQEKIKELRKQVKTEKAKDEPDKVVIEELKTQIKELREKAKTAKEEFNNIAKTYYEKIGELASTLKEFGVVHNDLASGNVFELPNKELVAIDFGRAKTGHKNKIKSDELTTIKRAIVDLDYMGIMDIPSIIVAIKKGYKKQPTSLQLPRQIDPSKLNLPTHQQGILLENRTKDIQLLQELVPDLPVTVKKANKKNVATPTQEQNPLPIFAQQFYSAPLPPKPIDLTQVTPNTIGEQILKSLQQLNEIKTAVINAEQLIVKGGGDDDSDGNGGIGRGDDPDPNNPPVVRVDNDKGTSSDKKALPIVPVKQGLPQNVLATINGATGISSDLVKSAQQFYRIMQKAIGKASGVIAPAWQTGMFLEDMFLDTIPMGRTMKGIIQAGSPLAIGAAVAGSGLLPSAVVQSGIDVAQMGTGAVADWLAGGASAEIASLISSMFGGVPFSEAIIANLTASTTGAIAGGAELAGDLSGASLVYYAIGKQVQNFINGLFKNVDVGTREKYIQQTVEPLTGSESQGMLPSASYTLPNAIDGVDDVNDFINNFVKSTVKNNRGQDVQLMVVKNLQELVKALRQAYPGVESGRLNNGEQINTALRQYSIEQIKSVMQSMNPKALYNKSYIKALGGLPEGVQKTDGFDYGVMMATNPEEVMGQLRGSWGTIKGGNGLTIQQIGSFIGSAQKALSGIKGVGGELGKYAQELSGIISYAITVQESLRNGIDLTNKALGEAPLPALPELSQLKQAQQNIENTFTQIQNQVKDVNSDPRVITRSGSLWMETSKIRANPQGLQYKKDGVNTKTGASGSISPTAKWNEQMAGTIAVWKDPNSDEFFVVNGHNRLAHAKSQGVNEVKIEIIDAPNMEKAKAQGALKNISEGQGKVRDASDYFRSIGAKTVADIERVGFTSDTTFSRGGGTVKDALGLAQLGDDLYKIAGTSRLSLSLASAIGLSGAKKGQEQQDLLKYLREKGKGLSGSELGSVAQEMASMMRSGGTVTKKVEQGSLLGLLSGEDPYAQEFNLMFEQAKAIAYVQGQFRSNKKLARQALGTAKSGKYVIDGQAIDVKQAQTDQEKSDLAIRYFDQFKSLTGSPINKAINQSARKILENNGVITEQIGKDLMAGVLNGIEQESAKVPPQQAKVADKLVSGIEDPLQISSPSRVFMEIGRNIMLGLEQGLFANDIIKTFPDEIQAMAEDAKLLIAQAKMQKWDGVRGEKLAEYAGQIFEDDYKAKGFDVDALNAKYPNYGVSQPVKPPVSQPVVTQPVAIKPPVAKEVKSILSVAQSPAQAIVAKPITTIPLPTQSYEQTGSFKPEKFVRKTDIDGNKVVLDASRRSNGKWYLSHLMVNNSFNPPESKEVRAKINEVLNKWMQELFATVGDNIIETLPTDKRSSKLWGRYGFVDNPNDYGKMHRLPTKKIAEDIGNKKEIVFPSPVTPPVPIPQSVSPMANNIVDISSKLKSLNNALDITIDDILKHGKFLGQGMNGSTYILEGLVHKIGNITKAEIESSIHAGEIGVSPQVRGFKAIDGFILSMDIAKGKQLSELFARNPYPISVIEESLKIRKKISEQGFSHDDGHGKNIFLDSDGKMQFIDWGRSTRNIVSPIKELGNIGLTRFSYKSSSPIQKGLITKRNELEKRAEDLIGEKAYDNSSSLRVSSSKKEALNLLNTEAVTFYDKAIKMAQDISKGFREGINLDASEQEIIAQSADLIEITQWVFGVSSPSKVFMEIGRMIVLGLEKGLDFSQLKGLIPKQIRSILGEDVVNQLVSNLIDANKLRKDWVRNNVDPAFQSDALKQIPKDLRFNFASELERYYDFFATQKLRPTQNDEWAKKIDFIHNTSGEGLGALLTGNFKRGFNGIEGKWRANEEQFLLNNQLKENYRNPIYTVPRIIAPDGSYLGNADTYGNMGVNFSKRQVNDWIAKSFGDSGSSAFLSMMPRLSSGVIDYKRLYDFYLRESYTKPDGSYYKNNGTRYGEANWLGVDNPEINSIVYRDKATDISYGAVRSGSSDPKEYFAQGAFNAYKAQLMGYNVLYDRPASSFADKLNGIEYPASNVKLPTYVLGRMTGGATMQEGLKDYYDYLRYGYQGFRQGELPLLGATLKQPHPMMMTMADRKRTALPALNLDNWSKQLNTPLTGLGVNIVGSLVDEIKRDEQKLAQSGAKSAEVLITGFTTPMQMNSPSKLFQYFGRMIIEGLSLGLNSDKPINTIQGMADKLKQRFLKFVINQSKFREVGAIGDFDDLWADDDWQPSNSKNNEPKTKSTNQQTSSSSNTTPPNKTRATVRCPACWEDNKPDAQECVVCGYPLTDSEKKKRQNKANSKATTPNTSTPTASYVAEKIPDFWDDKPIDEPTILSTSSPTASYEPNPVSGSNTSPEAVVSEMWEQVEETKRRNKVNNQGVSNPQTQTVVSSSQSGGLIAHTAKKFATMERVLFESLGKLDFDKAIKILRVLAQIDDKYAQELAEVQKYQSLFSTAKSTSLETPYPKVVATPIDSKPVTGKIVTPVSPETKELQRKYIEALKAGNFEVAKELAFQLDQQLKAQLSNLRSSEIKIEIVPITADEARNAYVDEFTQNIIQREKDRKTQQAIADRVEDRKLPKEARQKRASTRSAFENAEIDENGNIIPQVIRGSMEFESSSIPYTPPRSAYARKTGQSRVDNKLGFFAEQLQIMKNEVDKAFESGNIKKAIRILESMANLDKKYVADLEKALKAQQKFNTIDGMLNNGGKPPKPPKGTTGGGGGTGPTSTSTSTGTGGVGGSGKPPNKPPKTGTGGDEENNKDGYGGFRNRSTISRGMKPSMGMGFDVHGSGQVLLDWFNQFAKSSISTPVWKGLTSGLKKAEDFVVNTANSIPSLEQTYKGFMEVFDVISQQSPQAGRALNFFKDIVISAFGTAGIWSFREAISAVMRDTTRAFLQMEQIELGVRFTQGSGTESKMKELMAQSRNLGVDFETVGRGYSKLAIASKDTAIEPQLDFIFGGFLQAFRTRQVNPEAQGRALLALEQMISKDKISAEELRLQLSEAIPGAMGVGARAMGMSGMELADMLQSGQLTAGQFLPRFSAQLQMESSALAPYAEKSLQGSINKLNSEIFTGQAIIGESLIPVTQTGIMALSKVLEVLNNNAELVTATLLGLAVKLMSIMIPSMINVASNSGLLTIALRLLGVEYSRTTKTVISTALINQQLAGMVMTPNASSPSYIQGPYMPINAREMAIQNIPQSQTGLSWQNAGAVAVGFGKLALQTVSMVGGLMALGLAIDVVIKALKGLGLFGGYNEDLKNLNETIADALEKLNKTPEDEEKKRNKQENFEKQLIRYSGLIGGIVGGAVFTGGTALTGGTASIPLALGTGAISAFTTDQIVKMATGKEVVTDKNTGERTVVSNELAGYGKAQDREKKLEEAQKNANKYIDEVNKVLTSDKLVDINKTLTGYDDKSKELRAKIFAERNKPNTDYEQINKYSEELAKNEEERNKFIQDNLGNVVALGTIQEGLSNEIKFFEDNERDLRKIMGDTDYENKKKALQATLERVKTTTDNLNQALKVSENLLKQVVLGFGKINRELANSKFGEVLKTGEETNQIRQQRASDSIVQYEFDRRMNQAQRQSGQRNLGFTEQAIRDMENQFRKTNAGSLGIKLEPFGYKQGESMLSFFKRQSPEALGSITQEIGKIGSQDDLSAAEREIIEQAQRYLGLLQEQVTVKGQTLDLEIQNNQLERDRRLALRDFDRSKFDLALQVDSAVRQRAIEIRNLVRQQDDQFNQNRVTVRNILQSYVDLNIQVNRRALELRNNLDQVKRNIERMQLGLELSRLANPGDGLFNGFIDIVDRIGQAFDNYYNEEGNINLQALDAEQQRLQVARQVRDIQEQIYNYELQRMRQSEDLANAHDSFIRNQANTWLSIQRRVEDMEVQAKQMGVSFTSIAYTLDAMNQIYARLYAGLVNMSSAVGSGYSAMAMTMSGGMNGLPTPSTADSNADSNTGFNFFGSALSGLELPAPPSEEFSLFGASNGVEFGKNEWGLPTIQQVLGTNGLTFNSNGVININGKGIDLNGDVVNTQPITLPTAKPPILPNYGIPDTKPVPTQPVKPVTLPKVQGQPTQVKPQPQVQTFKPPSSAQNRVYISTPSTNVNPQTGQQNKASEAQKRQRMIEVTTGNEFYQGGIPIMRNQAIISQNTYEQRIIAKDVLTKIDDAIKRGEIIVKLDPKTEKILSFVTTTGNASKLISNNRFSSPRTFSGAEKDEVVKFIGTQKQRVVNPTTFPDWANWFRGYRYQVGDRLVKDASGRNTVDTSRRGKTVPNDGIRTKFNWNPPPEPNPNKKNNRASSNETLLAMGSGIDIVSDMPMGLIPKQKELIAQVPVLNKSVFDQMVDQQEALKDAIKVTEEVIAPVRSNTLVDPRLPSSPTVPITKDQIQEINVKEQENARIAQELTGVKFTENLLRLNTELRKILNDVVNLRRRLEDEVKNMQRGIITDKFSTQEFLTNAKGGFLSVNEQAQMARARSANETFNKINELTDKIIDRERQVNVSQEGILATTDKIMELFAKNKIQPPKGLDGEGLIAWTKANANLPEDQKMLLEELLNTLGEYKKIVDIAPQFIQAQKDNISAIEAQKKEKDDLADRQARLQGVRDLYSGLTTLNNMIGNAMIQNRGENYYRAFAFLQDGVDTQYKADRAEMLNPDKLAQIAKSLNEQNPDSPVSVDYLRTMIETGLDEQKRRRMFETSGYNEVKQEFGQLADMMNAIGGQLNQRGDLLRGNWLTSASQAIQAKVQSNDMRLNLRNLRNTTQMTEDQFRSLSGAIDEFEKNSLAKIKVDNNFIVAGLVEPIKGAINGMATIFIDKTKSFWEKVNDIMANLFTGVANNLSNNFSTWATTKITEWLANVIPFSPDVDVSTAGLTKMTMASLDRAGIQFNTAANTMMVAANTMATASGVGTTTEGSGAGGIVSQLVTGAITGMAMGAIGSFTGNTIPDSGALSNTLSKGASLPNTQDFTTDFTAGGKYDFAKDVKIKPWGSYDGGLIDNLFNGGKVNDVANYAYGGLVEQAQQALARERLMGGGKAVLSALTVGEYVIPKNPSKQDIAKAYAHVPMLRDMQIENYARGGMVGSSAKVGNITTNNSRMESRDSSFVSNIYVNANDASSFRKTRYQLEMEENTRMARASRRFG